MVLLGVAGSGPGGTGKSSPENDDRRPFFGVTLLFKMVWHRSSKTVSFFKKNVFPPSGEKICYTCVPKTLIPGARIVQNHKKMDG